MNPREDEKKNRSLFLDRKVAGVMVPLFSIRTSSNCGVGDILDLLPFIDWMLAHHLSVLQILPIYETAPDETSPYKALSSFAIDPVYLSVSGEEFLEENDILHHLETESVARDLGKWRESPTVCFEQIRAFKYELLYKTFSRFKSDEWHRKTSLAKALQLFIDKKSSWLDDYALFWQLKAEFNWSHWFDWPVPFQSRHREALHLFEKKREDGILFIKYVQWVLWRQWQKVHRHAIARDVMIMGDLPFLLNRDSADVWRYQDFFHRDVSLGAPPDDFSATGQDWGLPLFRWHKMEDQDLSWWRLRVREAGKTYDILRLDHVVGYFRVWVMPKEEAPYFEPGGDCAQMERGKKLLRAIMQESGDCIPLAEDLGSIPDFVRHILSEFQIAGHKVIRWEKAGDDYIDPRDYPLLSLATTGTHDTSTLLNWWQEISLKEREHFLKILNCPNTSPAESPLSDQLHRKIMDLVLGSGSNLVIFPIQDILLEGDRINIPGTIGTHNWCYRLPINLSSFDSSSPYQERLAFLRASIKRYKRD